MAPLYVAATFFAAITICSAQQLPACPLQFEAVPYSSPSSCSNLTRASLGELTSCCSDILWYYAQILAVHTNITSGQPLFLNATAQVACLEHVQNEVGDVEACHSFAPFFTAYATPCNFGALHELQGNLSLSGKATFDELFHSCTSLGTDCFDKLRFSVSWLASSLHDLNETCSTATIIAVISRNIANHDWATGLHLLLSNPRPTDHHGHSAATPFIHAVVFTVSAVFILLIVILARWKACSKAVEHERNTASSSSDGGWEDYRPEVTKPLPRSEALYAFSKKEIWKATKNFSHHNYIGEGSAGLVHRGALPSGQLVAVKHIDRDKKAVTFFKEVESLSKVRHPNLVSLLGYCQAGEDYYLVYEFCSKGNLSQWLFNEERVLTWEERLSIAIGSARGLCFLHMNPGGSIIHRDVKPTNILLNDSMEAKLSDFGLSKFIAIEESHVFTEVRGTSGYLDPEYMSKGQLTLASDVYSFGVVLLQLVSGRRPIELEHRYTIIKTAQRIVERGSDLCTLMDPRLEGDYSEAGAKKMIELSLACTSQCGNDRPSIKEVKDTLERIIITA